MTLAPGTVVGGDFRIEAPLAAGGMGAVFIATQLSTGRRRALKVMHALLVGDAVSRERFLEEARVGSQIESEHVVEVVGAGVDAETGSPWLAMELLEGETLADRVARGRLSAAELAPLMQGLRHGLGRAHARGIVHRDLKPENLFIARGRGASNADSLKILDFGIAKLLQGGRTAATQNIAGSPLWMAPEQADSREIRPATDVWALGLIAFDALVGQPYWRSATNGSTLTALLVEILTEPIEPASVRAASMAGAEVASGLPREFDAFFARCVERDPRARFRDASEALDALDDVLRGVPMRAVASPSRPPAQDAFAATALSLPPPEPGALASGAAGLATAFRATAQTAPVPEPTPLAATHPGVGEPAKGAARASRAPWAVAAVSLAGMLAMGWWVLGRSDRTLANMEHTPPLTQPAEALEPAPRVEAAEPAPPVPVDGAAVAPSAPAAPTAEASPPVAPVQAARPGAAPSTAPAPRPGRPRAGGALAGGGAAPAAAAPAADPDARSSNPDVGRFRSMIVVPCWRDNAPAGAAPVSVSVQVGFGPMGNITMVRVDGSDDANFRRCVVMRGTTYRMSAPPEEPTMTVRARLP
jgi:tRNA A-37 threonylcarbamoyl transferase component Bud32